MAHQYATENDLLGVVGSDSERILTKWEIGPFKGNCASERPVATRLGASPYGSALAIDACPQVEQRFTVGGFTLQVAHEHGRVLGDEAFEFALSRGR